MPSYRPDIDGLRAVAVLTVFAFHAGIAKVPGGFVGVDVFFVISGYLISSIIMRDLAAGRFSLARFYERRVRRILPALYFVLAACTVVGWWLLLPSRMEHFGVSMLAAALSVSNILFWSQSSYFDDALKTAPLLHTWSLGVEEQFYVVWPLLLMGLTRLGGKLAWAIGAVVVASLALAVHGVVATPSAAFFLLHTRAWELALGGLLACPGVRLPPGRPFREVAAAAGLALILVPCFAYTAATPFPGWAAVPPCVGAACIILAGRDGGASLTGRLLALSPVVLVGKVSYSLYLWHWPLIVLKAVLGFSFSTIGTIDKLAVIGLGLVLAWLTWWFIEQPFRDGRVLATRRAAFGFALGGAALAGVAGGLIALSSGVPGRFSPAVVATAAFLAPPAATGTANPCFIDLGGAAAPLDPAACLRLDPVRPNVLLFGDSHANHLTGALQAALPDIHFLVATGSGCRPMIDGGTPPTALRCAEMKAALFDTFLPNTRLDGVILAAAWKVDDPERLGRTLDALARMGHRVTVIGPIPMYQGALPELLALGMLRGQPDYAARRRVVAQEAIDSALRDALMPRPVRYISLHATLCHDGRCLERADDGAPLQFDYGHLTIEGARTVLRLLVRDGLLP